MEIYNQDQVIINPSKVNSLYIKTFLYLIGAILISGIVSLLTGFLLFDIIYPLINNSDTLAIITIIINIVTLLGLIITSIFINFISLRRNKTILVPGIIYSTFMGMMLGSMGLYLSDPYILGYSLLITIILFLTMILFTYIFKNSERYFLIILLGASSSVGLICLLNFFLFPFFVGASTTLFWIASLIIFFVVLLTVSIDMYRLKAIAKAGIYDKGIAMRLAFNFYIDFIYIFIRVFYFLSIIFASSRD